MKRVKKLFALLVVFAMALMSFASFIGCEEAELPNGEDHVCGHVCQECELCTDKNCNDPVCADKCKGHKEEPGEHECESKCEVPECGKCKDAECTDPVCEEKCPGHQQVEPEHECESKCEVPECGKCKDAECTDPVCEQKCPGHQQVEPEHECESKCEVPECGKCTTDCEEPECTDKCPGNHDEEPEPETYTVTLNAGEGTLEGETTLTTDEDGKLAELPEPTPAEGYDFDGWYTEAEAGEPVTTDTVFTSNDTIYAHYSEKLTLSASEVTLSIGNREETLTVTSSHSDVTWNSSAAAVVTVSGGALKAFKPGTATITATSGTKTAICTVTVEDAYYLIGGEDTSWGTVANFDVATAVYFKPTGTEGEYSTGSIELSRNAEFQIALVGDTTSNWWQKAYNPGNVTLSSGDVKNGGSNFKVETHGKYTIKINLTGAKPTVSGTMDEDLSGGVVEVDRWYIIGDAAAGWVTKGKDDDLGIYGFEYHADTGKYTLTVQLTKGKEFKVVIAGSAYNGEINEGAVTNGKIGNKGTATATGAYQLEWTSSSNIGVGVTGWYTFTIDPSVSGRGKLDYTFSLTDPSLD